MTEGDTDSADEAETEIGTQSDDDAESTPEGSDEKRDQPESTADAEGRGRNARSSI